MRFLSLSCRFIEEEVDVMEADDEDGDDSVDKVEEVEDLCKSMGDGFSSI